MAYCARCGRGSWACVCDLSYRERIGSIHVSFAGFETRDKRNYYERSSVDEMFGGMSEDERRETYMDDTKGRGAVTTRDVKVGDPDRFRGFIAGREVEDDFPT